MQMDALFRPAQDDASEESVERKVVSGEGTGEGENSLLDIRIFYIGENMSDENFKRKYGVCDGHS